MPSRRRKKRTSSIAVDNPYFNRAAPADTTNPAKIKARINRRESYPVYLFHRGTVDEAEFIAAKRSCAVYETIGGAGARAIDYGRQQVDGGQIAQSVTEAQLYASQTLHQMLKVLGSEGYHLTLNLTGAGLWPRDLAGEDEQRQRSRYIGERFKECLDVLAVHWGLKQRQTRSMIARRDAPQGLARTSARDNRSA